jgi:glycosyltransferase involved in cell wall biosynthesis
MRVAFVAPETVHHDYGEMDAERMAAGSDDGGNDTTEGETNGGTASETAVAATVPDRVRRLDRVARHLDARGHDVVWLCTPWWGAGDAVREFDDDRPDVDVVYRGVTDAPGQRRRFAVSVPLALRRADAEVVHADGGAPAAVVAAATGGFLGRAPVLAEWYRPGDGAMVRRATRATDLNVVPSRLVRRSLRERGVDEHDVEVVPEAIAIEEIDATPPNPEYEDDIVYARRLDDGANLSSFLLGLAELRGYDWTATILGDGPARAEYEQQARNLRIDDRVRFLGTRSRAERIAVYRSAHVFVQTARRAAFAEELLWALACGCVGVVEYQPESSAHELVEGRRRGFRVTSPEELADVVPEAGDLDRLDRDHDFDEFDRRPVLERYLACYRDLLGDPGLLDS